MPYYSRKVRGKNCYRVTKKSTSKNKSKSKSKRVFSKCTTKENAKKQMKLLRAIMFNKSFVPNGRQTIKRQTIKRRL